MGREHCDKPKLGSGWPNGGDGACGMLPWLRGLKRCSRGASEGGRAARKRCMPIRQLFRGALGAGLPRLPCDLTALPWSLGCGFASAAALRRPPTSPHHPHAHWQCYPSSLLTDHAQTCGKPKYGNEWLNREDGSLWHADSRGGYGGVAGAHGREQASQASMGGRFDSSSV